MNIPELLAPAGDKECAVYAISAGADAIYLGLQTGSARAGARNYTYEELNETLRYAHGRGCRVYLALNILESDSELKDAQERAVKAADMGVDAIIVQDLGLARSLIRMRNSGIIPAATQIHASTQMSVCTPEGAELLRTMGFDRLITAREMSLEGLRKLTAAGIPVECFVHGALCMSFSGQCLMSSYIGGRSGNRGTCAQPCRMKYILRNGRGNELREGYLLSPDDFCALPLLDRLCGTGVCSLKIEGRLKSPQYVAGVTRIYRKALDRVKDGTFGAYVRSEEYIKDTEELKLLFTRGNLTSGYLDGKLTQKDITLTGPGRKGLPVGQLTSVPKEVRIKGAECDFTEIRAKLTHEISVNDGLTVTDAQGKAVAGGKISKVKYLSDSVSILLSGGKPDIRGAEEPFSLYMTYCDKLMKELDMYDGSKEIRKCPVSMHFTAHKGQNASLTVSDGEGHSYTSVSSLPVSDALNAPMTEESVLKYLAKTGDTPFSADSVTFDMDPGLFMTAGEINAMRRQALSGLLEERATFSPEYSVTAGDQPVCERAELPVTGGNTLYFYDHADFLNSDPEAIERISPVMIYLPLGMWDRPEDAARASALVKKYNALLFAVMPFIPTGNEYDGIRETVSRASSDADGFLLTNLGDFGLVRKHAGRKDILLAADNSLNVWNSETAAELAALGVNVITVSPECLRDGCPPDSVPEGALYEMISEGPVPLMRTRYCMLSKGGEHCGACGKGNFEIEDTKGARYSIITKTRDCQNIITSSDSFPYSDKDIKKIAFRRIQAGKELRA